MALTIVTLQFHYEGCFVSDPTLRYANGITSVEKINIDVDELHIMLFHKIVLELGVENVETFGRRVNKKGTFYMLNIDSDVLNFLNGLKGADFVDVYVVHPISIHLVVEEILVLPSTSADVFLLVEEQAPAPRVEEHSDSLYNVDENIDDLDEDVKEKDDRENLDEIPYGPVGIDVDFEDIYKERWGRFEGNLGGDDPYFDSSDPGSDISEDERDHVENDEVVDPAIRKESTKIYFDPTAKKKNVAAKTSVASAATVGTNVAAGTSAATAGTNDATSNVAAGTSAASAETNAAIGSQSSVNAGPSARMPANALSSGVRPATTLASGGRPTSATPSDVRPLSTQQSTSSTTGQKRKTSTTLRGGATLAYKRPRQKKSKDSWLWSLIWIRWKGRTAVTQRQLREESYISTHGTPSTQGTK
ncbi:hypothetical protein R3W88_008834 [Solanum pinnatisectum]|uniref:PB1-like domain-containing protein n=1 Tax=Solanum pinnatisectum TaxID=50273 RepID=A0AAV9M952_9SOLN|nr:hypothetical protein R3W88_008834 [Solanum pinnatisectum]